jgi:hypothetical protein
MKTRHEPSKNDAGQNQKRISRRRRAHDAVSSDRKALCSVREAPSDAAEIPDAPGALKTVAFLRRQVQSDEPTVSLFLFA